MDKNDQFGIFNILIVLSLICFIGNYFSDDYNSGVSCERIPENIRKKHYVHVVRNNKEKCVKLSEKELLQFNIEELEQQKDVLFDKYCNAINYNNKECKIRKEINNFIQNSLDKTSLSE